MANKEGVVVTAAPLLIFVLSAAGFGVIAQIGVTLALRIAKSNSQFLGFCLMSLVFSGASTVVFSELLHWKPFLAAAVGAMLGGVPALVTLRMGVQAIAKKYGVDVDSADLKERTP